MRMLHTHNAWSESSSVGKKREKITKMVNETKTNTASALDFFNFYSIIMFDLFSLLHILAESICCFFLPILPLAFPREAKRLVSQQIANTIEILLHLITAKSFTIWPSSATFISAALAEIGEDENSVQIARKPRFIQTHCGPIIITASFRFTR